MCFYNGLIFTIIGPLDLNYMFVSRHLWRWWKEVKVRQSDQHIMNIEHGDYDSWPRNHAADSRWIFHALMQFIHLMSIVSTHVCARQCIDTNILDTCTPNRLYLTLSSPSTEVQWTQPNTVIKMNLIKAIGWLSLSTSGCTVVVVKGFSISSPSSPTATTATSRALKYLPRNNRISNRDLAISSALASTASPSSSIIGTPSTSFDDGTSPFEITTPIYYVNDKPHIGHAYTSTACDVIARFMRLSGREVFFLSGTDEHGQKVEQSAASRGLEPQDFVDEISKSFRDLLDIMNISNDEFIRTTSDRHKESVQVSLRLSLLNWQIRRRNACMYMQYNLEIYTDCSVQYTCACINAYVWFQSQIWYKLQTSCAAGLYGES